MTGKSCPLTRPLFLLAGIYGLLVLPPQYFFENRIGVDYPPAITHPEYFYGFIGVATVWQLVYLLIARDPVRYRPLMLLGALAKSSFAIAAIALFAADRLPTVVLGFSLVDLALGVLFVLAFRCTRAANGSA